MTGIFIQRFFFFNLRFYLARITSKKQSRKDKCLATFCTVYVVPVQKFYTTFSGFLWLSLKFNLSRLLDSHVILLQSEYNSCARGRRTAFQVKKVCPGNFVWVK
jgi:hypothetical protein